MADQPDQTVSSSLVYWGRECLLGLLLGTWVAGRQPPHRRAQLCMGNSSWSCMPGAQCAAADSLAGGKAYSPRHGYSLYHLGERWVGIVTFRSFLRIARLLSFWPQPNVYLRGKSCSAKGLNVYADRRLNGAYQGLAVGRKHWGAVGSRI